MKKNYTLIVCLLLLAGTAAFNQTINKNYIDGEVYFKLKREVPFMFDTLHRDVDIPAKLSFLTPLISTYNITKAESPFYFSKSDVLKRTFRLHFNNTKLVDALVKKLELMNIVEYAEKVPLNKVIYTPNDTYYTDSSVNGQWNLYKINAAKAWNVTRGNRSVLIAIVDNAIDTGHIDLKSNVVVARDVADNDNDTRPLVNNNGWEHGTHTSGTACAVTNNNTGVASIGFNCGLMAVKAQNNAGDGDYVNYGDDGISWAVANGASIISCSWGQYVFSATENNIITDAYNNNVLVVAAAGNENYKDSLLYPAGYNHVLSVTSTNINDQKSWFSNYGNWIDVSAPGENILSTFPGNQYGLLQGTSMATPLVAGLCGLIRSVNPSLTGDQVINIVRNTADNINAQNPGYQNLLGTGRINAYKAVESALPCNASLDLGSGYYVVPKTESSGSITSANAIASNAAVILDAATTVSLEPGFHAYSGSGFDAYIDGCGGNKFFDASQQSKNSNQSLKINYTDANVSKPGNKNLVAYPNPTSSIVHLDFTTDNDEHNVVVQAFNMQMQKVEEVRSGDLIKGKQSITLNLSKQASGLYYIFIQLQNEKLSAKVSLLK